MGDIHRWLVLHETVRIFVKMHGRFLLPLQASCFFLLSCLPNQVSVYNLVCEYIYIYIIHELFFLLKHKAKTSLDRLTQSRQTTSTSMQVKVDKFCKCSSRNPFLWLNLKDTTIGSTNTPIKHLIGFLRSHVDLDEM